MHIYKDLQVINENINLEKYGYRIKHGETKKSMLTKFKQGSI